MGDSQTARQGITGPDVEIVAANAQETDHLEVPPLVLQIPGGPPAKFSFPSPASWVGWCQGGVWVPNKSKTKIWHPGKEEEGEGRNFIWFLSPTLSNL